MRPITRRVLSSVLLLTPILVASVAADARVAAKSVRRPPTVRRGAPPAGDARAPAPSDRPAWLSGSTVAALGGDALFLDADSGELVRVRQGAPLARLPIGLEAALLVAQPAAQRAFVSDRDGDRIAVVGTAGDGLTILRTIATRPEPWGLALTPDGATLLVTTIAGRSLTAYDATTGDERWNLEVGPEARGVAISPAGDQAVVTFLSLGSAARVDLRRDEPTVTYVALGDAGKQNAAVLDGFEGELSFQNIERSGVVARPGRVDFASAGEVFARRAFATTFVGHGMVAVPHQLSTPIQVSSGSEDRGTYGGGGAFQPPVAYQLSFLGAAFAREGSGDLVVGVPLAVHQPDAVAYDGQTDTLYVAGYGSDEVLALGAASQAQIHSLWRVRLAVGKGACGPNGLALAAGGELLVNCSLSRTLVTVSPMVGDEAPNYRTTGELTRSRLSAQAQAGRALFRLGNDGRLSALGALACSSCHPDGRTDGLTWRIEGHDLQTPVLIGRLADTHPFKWDGKDKTLVDSLTNTIRRLGGSGIRRDEIDALAAYLTALPAPRTPVARDTASAERGRSLFEASDVGCATCHQGNQRTDGRRYDLAQDLDAVDTPALVGLAGSAPYYHDGSAATLRAVLLENGTVHGMGNTRSLSEEQIDDLLAYLETL